MCTVQTSASCFLVLVLFGRLSWGSKKRYLKYFDCWMQLLQANITQPEDCRQSQSHFFSCPIAESVLFVVFAEQQQPSSRLGHIYLLPAATRPAYCPAVGRARGVREQGRLSGMRCRRVAGGTGIGKRQWRGEWHWSLRNWVVRVNNLKHFVGFLTLDTMAFSWVFCCGAALTPFGTASLLREMQNPTHQQESDKNERGSSALITRTFRDVSGL